MNSKIIISETVCHDEAVGYLALRYSILPEEVIRCYMLQEGIINREPDDDTRKISFEDNEMAILRDMGICPAYVEFVKAK